MDEYHIVVKEEAIYYSKCKDYEDSQVYPYKAWSLLFIVVIVKAEIVTKWPSLDYTVNYQNNIRIQQCHDTIPTYNFVKHPWHTIKELFTQECQTDKNGEENSVWKYTKAHS